MLRDELAAVNDAQTERVILAMMRILTFLIFVFVWALPRWPTTSWAVWCGVVGVAEGDTLTLLDASDTQHKIRLAAINALERGRALNCNP